mmetsp:Transcript_21633/g.74293  ORF Transcript_21633/g.74293 Transcript_21633/m.74293 type:complete len:253 (-) Transcript_21633:1679-2437(-)
MLARANGTRLLAALQVLAIKYQLDSLASSRSVALELLLLEGVHPVILEARDRAAGKNEFHLEVSFDLDCARAGVQLGDLGGGDEVVGAASGRRRADGGAILVRVVPSNRDREAHRSRTSSARLARDARALGVLHGHLELRAVDARLEEVLGRVGDRDLDGRACELDELLLCEDPSVRREDADILEVVEAIPGGGPVVVHLREHSILSAGIVRPYIHGLVVNRQHHAAFQPQGFGDSQGGTEGLPVFADERRT